MAGIDHLHNGFPIGSRVTLSLRGLAIAESRGVLQAGRPPAAGSGYATDYIGSRAALGSVLVRSGEALAAPSPAPLAIPALTESRCGTLVRIDGVRYTPEDLSAATWAGYKRFTDADGNAVYTYVRRYARFADAEVPAGTVSLTTQARRSTLMCAATPGLRTTRCPSAAVRSRESCNTTPPGKGVTSSNCAMRTTARISLLTLPVLLTLPAGCDRATQPEFTVRPPEPQNSVAYLKSLCDGKSSVAIAQDITIRGFVTANDLYGEFHRTIVVEDASGGISIAAEGSPLADLYPFGIVATVRCNGLTLCDYGGKIQLGTTPGDGGAGCIPREELARYIRTEPPGGETPSAQLLTFDAVSARHIDTRVRFDDVRFADAGKTWCDTDPETGRAVATEREIVDTRGRTFTVRTAATCVYAKEPLPQGTGSLYGIIDYFAGKYTLRVTNREAEFSGTAAHSAATRPTAGRPARTTRTTRAGVTAATPPTAYP